MDVFGSVLAYAMSPRRRGRSGELPATVMRIKLIAHHAYRVRSRRRPRRRQRATYRRHRQPDRACRCPVRSSASGLRSGSIRQAPPTTSLSMSRSRATSAPRCSSARCVRCVSEAEALRVRIVEHEGVPRQVIDDAMRVVAGGDRRQFAVRSARRGRSVDEGRPRPRGRSDAGAAVPLRAVQGRRRPVLLVRALPPHRGGRLHDVADRAPRRGNLHRAQRRDDPATDGAFGPLRVLLDEDAAYRGSDAVARRPRVLGGAVEGSAGRGRLGDERPLSGRRTKPRRLVRRRGPAARRISSGRPAISRNGMSCGCARWRSGMGMRLPHLLAAATAMFLHRMTGERDVVIGLPVAARDARGAQRAGHGVERHSAARRGRSGYDRGSGVGPGRRHPPPLPPPSTISNLRIVAR